LPAGCATTGLAIVLGTCFCLIAHHIITSRAAAQQAAATATLAVAVRKAPPPGAPGPGRDVLLSAGEVGEEAAASAWASSLSANACEQGGRERYSSQVRSDLLAPFAPNGGWRCAELRPSGQGDLSKPAAHLSLPASTA